MKTYQKRKALEQLIPAETQKVLIAGKYHTSTVCLKSPKSCGQPACKQHGNYDCDYLDSSAFITSTQFDPDSLCLHFLL